MIVRCNNCVSAFSVDDDKVANKVFAFTCPKCGTENIVDNKIKAKPTIHEELDLDNDFFIDSDTNKITKTNNDLPEHRNLNLEIEESENFHDIKGGSSDEFDIELKEDRDIAKGDKDFDKDIIFDDFNDGDLTPESGDNIQNNDDIDQLLMETSSTAESNEKNTDSDDITIDIDSLDIELDETFSDDTLTDTSSANEKTIDELHEENFDDEDIKLNLDELDLDIDTIEKSTDSDDITIDVDNLDIELEEAFSDDIPADSSSADDKTIDELFDDEDIKLNLDELDIDIDTMDEMETISMDAEADDEKLTLDDAGLTFDELTQEAEEELLDDLSDEEIKLTLNDIDPDLTLEEIIKSAETDSKLALESLEELPEIYSDEDEAAIITKKTKSKQSADEEDYDIFDYDNSVKQMSSYRRRVTSFSIDLSLRYSRIRAILRLFSLYIISMIPHFIVLMIYSMLSSILGFINQLVIFTTGRCVDDFGRIIENTIRYGLYIETNLIGIVDDRPVYAGRKDIEHLLQFDVTFPSKYSKKMAILRLSIIGITIVTLPHIIIIALLSLTMPLCYLIGILSVIITRRWPNILFKYVRGYFKYRAHTASFMLGLTDDYPPFRF